MVPAHSCADGPSFRVIDPLPDGMAVVYVYRPAQGFRDGQSQSVYVNDREIASLYTRAYTYYMTLPGMVNVKIRGLREAYMRFEVEGGKSYFLKSSVKKISSGSAATGIDVLSFMDDETGLQEITSCQLSALPRY
jgi:hypothetical protein